MDSVTGTSYARNWEVTMATQLASVTQGIPTEVAEHLQRHHVITLSTSSFTGMPHADTVVYVSDSRSILFFAGEDSQMMRNINDSKRVSFTVDDYTVDWRKVRELQGVGRCQEVPASRDAAVRELYASKFGQASPRPPGIPHAIIPIEMHFVDYDYAKVAGEALAIRRTFQPSPARSCSR
jgi:nitroimidazol reductase NimA-like FMN-containing flavoprotein (pyridoxamine 5'-phosphate oxidase superfamily)